MARYKKAYNAFNELSSGLVQAQGFYTEMIETVDSLKKNVDTFVNNRRSEGAQLLNQIERDKASVASGQEDREREKLRQLMERLSTEPAPTSSSSPSKQKPSPVKTTASSKSPTTSPHYPSAVPVQHVAPPSQSPAPFPPYIPAAAAMQYFPGQHFQQGAAAPLSEGYNPMAYPYPAAVSPPPTQPFFSTTPTPFTGYPHANPPPAPSHTPQFMPPGYIPPPPPPRPSQTAYPSTAGPYPSGPGGYAQSRPFSASSRHKGQSQPRPQSQTQQPLPNDPWSGLNAWK
jgi:ALIX V-shaped domain binding to HIV